MNTLQGKSIIVTGAGGGIGTAVCRLLSGHGARVVAVGSTNDDLTALPASLAITAALEDAESWTNVVAETLKQQQRIDAWIHSVGLLIPGKVHTLSPGELRKLVDANFLSFLYGLRAISPVMIRQRHGHMIAIGSLGGILPMPFESVYSATKFAVRGLCLSASEELRASGVHVSLLSAGPVATRMLDLEARDTDSYVAFLAKPLPPKVIAEAVCEILRRPRRELLLPRSAGILSSIFSHIPSLSGRLLQLLRPLGTARRKAYLKSRGAALTTPIMPKVTS